MIMQDQCCYGSEGDSPSVEETTNNDDIIIVGCDDEQINAMF